MGKIVLYEHHGNVVSVDEEFKGRHRDACLCYRCKRFTVMNDDGTFDNDREDSCQIANELFEFVKKNILVAPVFECGEFFPR